MKTKKNGSSKPLSAKPQNKLTFDALVSKDIEAEIVLNKIADFANLKISIEEFLRLSFIEIGKLKWVCKSCKYSIYLLDEDKTKLTLAAHKHLSKRELKKCEFIPLIKKAARALEKPGIKTNGNLINEISKHLDINKKTHANRYLINIKHNHQILGIIHVATKDDLMKNEVAGKFIAAFTTLAAETILRKKDEAARIFEKEANDSLAELATMFLSSNKISTEVISNMVVKKAQELTKSKFAFISYLDPHEGHMVIPTFSESVWQKCRVKEKSKIFTNFKDIWSHLLKIKKPILSNNPKTNSFSNGAPKGHVTIENYIAVPAVLNNKLIGLIAIANTKHNYDEADLTYLKRLANFYAITLSRKFEAEKLKYAEEKYRSIIESNNNLIYTINPEGIITFINHNAKNYGYKPEEVIGKHMSKFCHRDDLPLAYTELKKLLKTGKSSKSFIIRFKRKDGSFYYGEQRSGVIYKNGKIEATISNMHDITERKTMQDRIKENEKTLQIIFDTATDMILLKDINHKFIKVNKACAKFFNMPAKKLIGKTGYDIFPKEIADKAMTQEDIVLKHGKTLQLEAEKKTNTQIRTVNIIKTPIKNEKGEITGLLAIMRDITEFKKLQEESIHKQVLEEAGKITGKAAHDFNNVLSSISGYSTLMLENLGDKNPVGMELEAIKKAVERAVKITNEMQNIKDRRG